MMLQKIGVVLFTLILSTLSFAQSLEDYVSEGIKANLALQKESFILQQSMAALDEARGLFLPSIGIEARYSRAGGGRNIEFPTGDLLNEVYSTLNQLTGTQQFPQLENTSIPFLREKEHDTKLQLIQPLFQPQIYHNYRAKKNLAAAQASKRNAFKRQLTVDIKTAYFNYQKSLQVENLLNSTVEVLQENLRVSNSLFKNDKVTQEVVFRSEAELADLKQQIAEARKNRTLAANYFNFLLNRPLNSSISQLDDDALAFVAPLTTEDATSLALKQRDELHQLRYVVGAAGNGVGAAKSRFLPAITLVADYGFQGEDYSFTSKDDYWMGSVVLSWNLFNGGQDKAKVQQAQLEKKRLIASQKELDLQIQLQVEDTHQNLLVAKSAIAAAHQRVISNRKSFRIIEKKYASGIAPQIEYLDVRNSLTQSEISHILARYDYQIRYAEYERVVAINKQNNKQNNKE